MGKRLCHHAAQTHPFQAGCFRKTGWPSLFENERGGGGRFHAERSWRGDIITQCMVNIAENCVVTYNLKMLVSCRIFHNSQEAYDAVFCQKIQKCNCTAFGR